MALNYSSVFYLDKHRTRHTISTMYRYKKGDGYSTVWTSGGDSDIGFDISTPTDNSYFTFTLLDDDTYSIAAADITNMPEDLVIPDTYEGKAVTVIPDNAFAILSTNLGSIMGGTYSGSLIKNIYIPASITSIGNQAFAIQISLSSLIVANNSNLTSIGTNIVTYSGLTGALSVNLEGATKLTTMGENWFAYSGLIKIIFPRNVRSIGDSAFKDCNSLTSIVIPDSVTTIGNEAFGRCGSLVSITIPDSVTSIGNDAFWYCKKLTNITIPDNVASIGDSAFADCDSLTSIVIPDSVTSIGKGWFVSCDNLTSVVIPNSVTSIGERAFDYCSNLTTVVIPDSVASVGYQAFEHCDNLTIYCEASSQPSGWSANWRDSDCTIVWGYTCHKEGHSYTLSVTEPTCYNQGYTTYTCSKCGDYYTDNYTDALGHAESDWIITKEATPTSTGSKHTECTRCGSWVNSAIIPILTTSEDYFTFRELDDGTYSVRAKDITNLPDYVVIPSTYNGKAVTQIADIAFGNATISNIYIPEGITSIGYAAFGSCSNIANVNLPASVTSIGEQTFNLCDNLVTFTIADNSQLTSIGRYAFNGCGALEDIGIPASVTTIGEYAFRNCSNLTINCEVEFYYKPSGWATTWAGGCPVIWGHTLLGDDYLAFTELADGTYSVKAKDVNNIPAKVALPSIYNGKAVTSIAEKGFYHLNYHCDSLTSVVIPDSVTSIGSCAFWYCTNLTNVVIPNSVTSIGGQAFEYCSSLTSVEIPNSVASIGNSAFASCSSLTSITIPDSVTSIGNNAFQDCSSLTSITIPNSVETIGSCALRRCSNLANIVIPDSVTYIGSAAFEDNPALTSITIPASVITIDAYAFRNCSNLTINCEATEQPSGWNANWNSSNCPVVWGYTG